MSNDSVMIIDTSSSFLAINRAYVSFSHVSKELYLPFLSIAGHSSIARASFTTSILYLILAPENYVIGVGQIC